MKTKIQKFKIALAVLLLCGGLGSVAQAQTSVGTGTIPKGPVNLGPGSSSVAANRGTALGSSLVPAYENSNVVLFYDPTTKPGFTLVASENEDLTDVTGATGRTARKFTDYNWFYMGTAGTAAAAGTAFNTNLAVGGYAVKNATPGVSNKLTLTNLTEGFHYFKVQGVVNPDGIPETELCVVKEEIYVVYVLPTLKITATGVLPSGTTGFQYCESETEGTNTQSKLKIATTYAFENTDLTNPAASAFEVKYNWYAVKGVESAPGSNVYTYPFSEATAKTAVPTTVTGVTLQTPTALTSVAGAIEDFAPQLKEFGKYKLFVEVEYTLKDRGVGKGVESPTDRHRTYAIYRAFAKDAAGTDLVLAVTPTPGKPHITIESVND